MLSKKEIAETIILQKYGGRPSSDNGIDVRDVYDVVDMIYSQLVSQQVEQQIRGKGDFTVDSVWSKTFTNSIVLYDKTLDQCYINLPATRVYIQGDKDIRLISWTQSQNAPFDMIDSASLESQSLLESGVSRQGTYNFYVDGQRVIFPSMPKRYKGKKILVRMVAAIDGYAPDEKLPIPSSFSYTLLEMTAAYFQVQITTLSKNTNDSNVNIK
jgi:hypothetical protein